jgi:hypothetical protein
MFLVQWERIKNQPSNSTSCSDNALQLVGSCGGQIISKIARGVFNSNLGMCFEGLFWERYIFEGPHRTWRALKTSILSSGEHIFVESRCPYKGLHTTSFVVKSTTCSNSNRWLAMVALNSPEFNSLYFYFTYLGLWSWRALPGPRGRLLFGVS